MASETATTGQKKLSIKPDNIYETRQLSTQINLAPKALNYSDVNQIILERLKKQVEGKCIGDGFIKDESVEIISRSPGMLLNHDFSGSVAYEIIYSAEVCNPKEGQILEVVVDDNNNETNTVCYYVDEDTSPIEIYLFKQHYLENPVYAGLKKGDKILVKILETQVEFGESKIYASAEFLSLV
jgi:DNA-directed RNA polymerase subunit E'/Rpb7